ncbi:clock-controlled protein 15 [Sporothrix schenckii 1099-18]|uniref:Clock-controlled protein 15 n=1 Tax=Sporothrix schenckii 1099-18 TaxID=1397361 RepID=A0A0F2LW71_SPOSC|nr:clock-controlled protein 15 [Sporothrix schenckii 1099-18]KJR81079.1 clock-controlled protein 15 [Sporothrix schenckii 1099-18]
MFSKQILPVFAAAAGVVSAASSSSDICKQDTFTVNSQADITNLLSCSTLTGNVVIGNQTDATLDFTGIKVIDGDLTLLNNNLVTTLKSDTTTEISGNFHLQNLTTLSTLSFSHLTSVGSINWISLTAIDVLTFTAGIKTAKSIVVSDTFLSSLDGLDVASADTININNNRRLVSYTSSLGNLTTLLNINANGLDLNVSFPNLIWIANMTISNVSSFSVPSLATVNGSMRFDSNFFDSFSAPNLTETSTGDISFVSNAQLSNITIPKLTSIGGGFLLANNTAQHKVNGFNKLKTVGGAINMRGNFTDIELPALNDVKGAFDIVSTGDISASCDSFKKLAPSSQGGGGQIQGKYTCESNNAQANSDTNPTSTGSSSGSSPTGKGNSAAGISVNSMAVLGLAGVAAFAQML